ncbi:MAG TPA: hypothetical protein VJW20_01905 [Candidatus Angelobacter sp.]|nr:hypothetical protein [Candidatus Angelobacter sp.]
MKRLLKILAKYAEAPEAKLGDKGPFKPEGTPPLAAREADQLRSEMRAILERNKIFFVIAFSLVVAVFIGLCIFIVSSLGDPAGIKKAMTAAGITIFGPIGWMLKLWKEKVATDLTLALVSNLKSEDIRPVLGILLRKLK